MVPRGRLCPCLLTQASQTSLQQEGKILAAKHALKVQRSKCGLASLGIPFLSFMDRTASSSSFAGNMEHSSVIRLSSTMSARMRWRGKSGSTISFIFTASMEQGDRWVGSEPSFLVTNLYPRPHLLLLASLISSCKQRVCWLCDEVLLTLFCILRI